MSMSRAPFSKRHYRKWFLLTFVAGSVNAGGYLATHRFVTHVTGFATLFGVELASQKVWEGLGYLSVPLFFLLGAMTSAVFVDRKIQSHERPVYVIPLLLVTTCLLTAALGGYLGWFGIFGEVSPVRGDYVLMALLCLAMGTQNALITTISGNVVRTTHLTGVTTDLGIGLVRIIFPKKDGKPSPQEYQANLLRFGTIAFFALGSAVGAFLFQKVAYLGFLAPAFITLALTGTILSEVKLSPVPETH